MEDLGAWSGLESGRVLLAEQVNTVQQTDGDGRSSGAVPSPGQSLFSNLHEKNALASPQQKMQGHIISQTAVSSPVVFTGVPVLQSFPQGILVENAPLIQVPVLTPTANVISSDTSGNVPPELTTSSVQVVPAAGSAQFATLKPDCRTFYQLKISTHAGVCGQVTLFSSPTFQPIIVRSFINDVVHQVYRTEGDIESYAQPKTVLSEKACSTQMVTVKSIEMAGGALSEEKAVEGQVEEEPVPESQVIEEAVVDSASALEEASSTLHSSKVCEDVICPSCGYASPDPLICQKCRRPLAPRTPPPPASPPAPEPSPYKSKRGSHHHHHRRSHGHHHNSKERRSCHRAKREERRREEASRILEDTTVSLLSSDEEDERVAGGEGKRGTRENGGVAEGAERRGAEGGCRTDVFSKEPVITPDSTEDPAEPHDSLRGGGLEVESLMDSSDIERIALVCRTVRFGSYKAKPLEAIVLTEHGVRLKVPTLAKNSTTIKILMKDIVKVLIYFGRAGQYTDPTFFFYVTHEASKRIREALHMTAKNKDLFFDSASKEELHKRITLLPEGSVSVSDRLFIKAIYESRCLMEELSWDEANEILVRAAPMEVQQSVHLKQDAPTVKHLPTPPNSSESIQQIMIYPAPPYKGGISINTEDYGCLKEDQFLNDVIIDFYLKYLWLNVFTDEQRKRTHIFSSFFYKRLTMMPPRHSHTAKENLPPAEKRHARVKGWTKSVDIFDKDFIIIPINEKSHWFLGIVCFPGLDGPVRMSDGTPVPDTSRRKGADKQVLSGGQVPAKIWGTTISIVKHENRSGLRSGGSQASVRVDDDPSGNESERDEAEADDEEIEPDTTDEESGKDDDQELLDEATPPVSKVKPNLEAIKQPCILIFDSLMSQSRAKVVATLREYLQVEWKVRHKGKSKDFSKDVFKGAVPKVPQQPNFVDCGLYLLQFVEAFFKNPITDYRMPIRSIKEWFTADVVSRKRFDIMTLLHQLMSDQNIDTSQLNLPHLDLNPYGEFDEPGEEEEEEEEEVGRGVDTSMEMGGEEEELAEEEEEEEELGEERGESAGTRRGGELESEEMEVSEEPPQPPPPPPQLRPQRVSKQQQAAVRELQIEQLQTKRFGDGLEVSRGVEINRVEGGAKTPVRGGQQSGRSPRVGVVTVGGQQGKGSSNSTTLQQRGAVSISSGPQSRGTGTAGGQQEKSVPSPVATPQRRYDSPAASPRLDRSDVSIQPRSLDAKPTDTSRSSSQTRPRLPDSVTICEANSKRKLPLSLKDIRNTRLPSSQSPAPPSPLSQPSTLSDKIKKARME